MLVLSRKKDEGIVINDDILIRIVGIRGDRVRVGIEAPEQVPVHREEVWISLKNQKPDGKCHEFDSSLTCNYCGVAAEKVGGMAEKQRCPAR